MREQVRKRGRERQRDRQTDSESSHVQPIYHEKEQFQNLDEEDDDLKNEEGQNHLCEISIGHNGTFSEAL